MHHKFAIIDANDAKSGKAMYGSLNFSMQAIIRNYENLIITNNCIVINELNNEFEYLWGILSDY